ncbi:bifunctional proline dehydrogenase/L-glutamate gamma-semialdehyde dehydrogenase [Cellulomonas sp. KRMCY2]|uniref:bifunctional proline dehydrogenase/L-glutamate gamma-semialdehyde dehydrogenase n=1 Tax=Cellulomonas sp. KRMCY2 TaxID=1304865 RepID=UPI00045EA355|nr:bifunctional proline dehydrogenase/L-glutamate gamma-semialdehyde dehydrogenase [Cellulomonas sp. KRMCY2]
MDHPVTSLADAATALAQHWIDATAAGETEHERRTTGRLAALVSDPAGLELAVRFVDRVARPQDVDVAARELAGLAPYTDAAGGFLGPVDRVLLGLGTVLAPVLPALVVPAARFRLRQLVGHLVADAGPGLAGHIARARADGFRLNLNLLGEAVLGAAEAAGRLARVTALVARPDVDYVSVKVSSVASQLSTWDIAGSRDRVVATLLPLYRTARDRGTFLNLDMEEYRDLALTTQVFERLLVEPELHDLELGIVLQAYLPDALGAFEAITAMAAHRVARGGARAKVRLVKGANLAMEQVEGVLHGWEQAPYPTKAEVDASYVRLVDRALRPGSTAHLRVGVASHNLFDVALAHLLAQDRGVGEALDIEMLQGMAPAQARAVRDDVGRVLLYTPVVARSDFDVAIAYLIRRLEENAAAENFLHDLFAAGGSGGSGGLDGQRKAFIASLHDAEVVATAPRRRARPVVDLADREDVTDRVGPAGAGHRFRNATDTDPAVAASRRWAIDLLTRDVPAPPAVVVDSVQDVDAAVARATAVADRWAATAPHERGEVLRRAAVHLERARGDLVATMVHEAGKTIAEADPEVSEAVDFARYYADQAELLADGAVPGARFRPHGLTVVTPPWNFPVAIPVGSVLAALAAGSPVLVKPAHLVPRCTQVAMAAVHRAMDDVGVPRDVLQVVIATERAAGRRLVSHPAVARVVLTGSIETAQLFASWRADLEVVAETSGKNALVVTPSADVDLAVADVVRSAFGHAGQKCSAASLLILVGSAGRSTRLRRQLADAVSSLAVGPATDLSTTMGPLTEPAAGKLLRALTTLDPGEHWLVRPRQLDAHGYQWSPGVKHGVAAGSFLHTTECFGPVLGVMRTETLEQAIALQNAVAFGLTGGLHSLDEAEIATWLETVEVGNAYVNRHITGAIVGRQPFGGWKASVVGPGAKAGGPNYVAQLGEWSDAPEVPQDDVGWLAWATADDERCWSGDLGVEHELAGLGVEANVLRYRPVPLLTVRVGTDARDREVTRVLAAAERAGVPVTVSSARVETDDVFAARVRSGDVTGRIRLIGSADGLTAAARTRTGEVTVIDGPVLAAGRRELLTVLREQAISRTVHRLGHVSPGEPDTNG